MAKDDPDDDQLPDKDAAKGFYAKYEPKEVKKISLLRNTKILIPFFFFSLSSFLQVLGR